MGKSYNMGGEAPSGSSKAAPKKRESGVELNRYESKDKSKEPKEKKEKKPKTKSVSFTQMYKYSSTADRVALAIGLIFTLAGGSGVSVILWFSSNVLNDLYGLNMTGNDTGQMQYDAIIDIAKKAAVVIAIIDVVTFICLFIGMTLWLRAADRIVQRVRRLAFNNLVRQHMGFFDLNEPGAIITSLAEDCIKYQSGMGEKVVSSFTWASQMISATVVSFIGDWLLSLIAFALLPVTLIATGLATKYIRKLATAQFVAYGKAGVVAEESISAIKIVQAFSGEDKQSSRYDDRLVDARKLGQKAGYFVALANCVSFLIALVVIAIIFWVGGVRYLRDKLTDPGVLIQVTLASGQAMRNFAWIANNNEFITNARAAAASIYKYIQCQSEIDSLDPSGEKPSEVSGEITFEGIHFEYPSRADVPVLKGLTLTIPRGKNVALVGPSGCGKSTTIQLIQRYYDPRTGVVKIDGKDVKSLNLKWMRNQIGVVAQEPVLFATSVEENIRFGRPGATTAEIMECAKEADAHNFIMQLPEGYQTVLNESATVLSRGEKQRVSLARALVRKPTILLLDECTSALDTESEVVVQKALEKAARGRTTITIAHRLSTVRNSDILYVINEGILWEQGNHEELMAKEGLYRGLVENQMKGMETRPTVDDPSDDEDDLPQVELTRSPSLISTRSARETLEKYRKQAADEEDEVTTKPKASMKRIFSYNKPETCLMVMGCICALIFGFGLPAMAILIGELFVMFRIEDKDEKREILFLYCPIMIGVVVIVSIASFIGFSTLKYAGEWLTQRIRSEVFKHILRMEIGWFDRKDNQVGALTSRLANDASRVQAATGTVLVTLFSAFSTLVGAIVVSIVYGWRLGLPLLAYTPFTVSVSIIQSFINTKFSQWTANASREGGKIIAEVIDKINVVASLTKEDFFEERFNKFFDDLAIKERKKALLGGLAWGLTYFFIGGSFLLSFPYGLYRVAEGDIQPENIVRILFGVAASTQELARLNVYATEFTRARAAAAQLFQILDRKSEIDPLDKGGRKPDDIKGGLEVRKCFFKYPTRKDLIVLKNFSLEVKRGQFIAMVGPSGSGKTSAVTLFERFYNIMGGDVLIDGVPISDLNLKWVRAQMSIVTQDPILFNIGLNDNIAFGDNTREVSSQEIIEAAKNANIHNFIATLPKGYDTPAGTKGTQLSGGQKQRVSIARALIKNPKILLLDDAMSALDAESEKQVEVALEKAREGRTTIMVSHRLSSIIKADMIYVVDGGKIVERGTHTSLMARRHVYYKLQQASMGMSK